MGTLNTSNSFQHSMNRFFAGILYQGVIIYIDDLVAYRNMLQEQLRSLEKVFQKLDSVKLKLKTTKCIFFYQNIDLLGHNLSAERVRPPDKNLKVITEFSTPMKMTMYKVS